MSIANTRLGNWAQLMRACVEIEGGIPVRIGGGRCLVRLAWDDLGRGAAWGANTPGKRVRWTLSAPGKIKKCLITTEVITTFFSPCLNPYSKYGVRHEYLFICQGSLEPVFPQN